MAAALSRQSMSPQSAANLDNYMKAYKVFGTPNRKNATQAFIPKLIDISDLNWEELLKIYCCDFDWDTFEDKYWESLESRCETKKGRYSADEYKRFRIAELLKDIFMEHKEAEKNFENFLKRIMQARKYDLAQAVYDQIIKLTEYENQKNTFPIIFAKIQTDQKVIDSKNNRLFGSIRLWSLTNRCKPIGSMNFKKAALIGAAVSLVFGMSFAAWKNYFQ